LDYNKIGAVQAAVAVFSNLGFAGVRAGHCAAGQRDQAQAEESHERINWERKRSDRLEQGQIRSFPCAHLLFYARR
jgi:hypothetical protein